ncbi:MAG: hypothetical protein ACLSAP_02245 [Oscillospiraceae bacterium]
MKKANRFSCILIAALMLYTSFAFSACQYDPVQDSGISFITAPYEETPYFFEDVTIEGLRQSFEQSERFQKRKIENDVDYMRYKDRDTKVVVTTSLDPPVDHAISFDLLFKGTTLTDKNKPKYFTLIKQVLAFVNIEIDDDTAAKVLSGSFYSDDLYVRDQTTEGGYTLYVYPGSAKSYFEPEDPNRPSSSSASQ